MQNRTLYYYIHLKVTNYLISICFELIRLTPQNSKGRVNLVPKKQVIRLVRMLKITKFISPHHIPEFMCNQH